MFDNVVVVYKFFGDLMFFVTGSQDENEIVLYTVLQAFFESISLLLRQGFTFFTQELQSQQCTLLAMSETCFKQGLSTNVCRPHRGG